QGQVRPEKFLPHEPEHPAVGLKDIQMSILYRPARAEDLQRAGELVTISINELCGRHGFPPMAAVRPPTFATFSLEDDADGLWVAEDAGEIVGFAFSWVCGDLCSPSFSSRRIDRDAASARHYSSGHLRTPRSRMPAPRRLSPS